MIKKLNKNNSQCLLDWRQSKCHILQTGTKLHKTFCKRIYLLIYIFFLTFSIRLFNLKIQYKTRWIQHTAKQFNCRGKKTLKVQALKQNSVGLQKHSRSDSRRAGVQEFRAGGEDSGGADQKTKDSQQGQAQEETTKPNAWKSKNHQRSENAAAAAATRTAAPSQVKVYICSN